MKLFKKVMDANRLKSTWDEQKGILALSLTVYLLYKEGTAMLSENGIDLIADGRNALNALVPGLGPFFEYAAGLAFSFVSFALIYSVVQSIKKRRWIKKHRDIWVRGTWACIHKKYDGQVRVGKAVIRQFFNNITIEGVNYRYDAPRETQHSYTRWEYKVAALNEQSGAELIFGSYRSTRFKNDVPSGDGNMGIHILYAIERSDNRTPTMLAGNFTDVHRGTEQALGDHIGEIFLYRVDPDKLDGGGRDADIYIHPDDYPSMRESAYCKKIHALLKEAQVTQ